MIEVTRLDGSRLYINPEHIWTAEAKPDTVITFLDGKKIVVADTPAQLIEKIIAYKGRIMRYLAMTTISEDKTER